MTASIPQRRLGIGRGHRQRRPVLRHRRGRLHHRPDARRRRRPGPAGEPRRCLEAAGSAARLAGRICVITGAAGGIGAATVELFRAEGGTVIGFDLARADPWPTRRSSSTYRPGGPRGRLPGRLRAPWPHRCADEQCRHRRRRRSCPPAFPTPSTAFPGRSRAWPRGSIIVMRVDVALLGGFAISVTGVPVPTGHWHRRQTAALVKLLALAPRSPACIATGHRRAMARRRCPDAALPRLYKAAHFARQASAPRHAVVAPATRPSRCSRARLWTVDVDAFETAAVACPASGARAATEACLAAIALYPGDLLPDDLNEPWSERAPSCRLQARFQQLLRGAPADGTSCSDSTPPMRRHTSNSSAMAVLAGDRPAALRRYDDMERVLDRTSASRPARRPSPFASECSAPPSTVPPHRGTRRDRPPAIAPQPTRHSSNVMTSWLRCYEWSGPLSAPDEAPSC